MTEPNRHDVIIVGGGYTGAAAAIHLSRLAKRPLSITVIEPRAQLGRGIAYDTVDPTHRLNINPEIMILYLDDIDHFPRYVKATGVLADDPAAQVSDGMVYPRRAIFGDYMVDEVAAHQINNPSRSTIHHLRDRAVALAETAQGLRLTTAEGRELAADRVLLCPSHGRPSLPAGLSPDLARDPRYVADPWDNDAIGRIAPDARLLVLGTGLTAGDVLSTLRHSGHRGRTLMLSRHGIPPQQQFDLGDVNALIARIARPVPLFIERHGQPTGLLDIMTAVRADIAAARAEDPDADWRHQFDHVRDAGGAIWRSLSDGEKRRYVRHLKTYYDAHRNRVAPQVMATVATGLSDGSLAVTGGRIVSCAVGEKAIDVTYRPRHGADTVTRPFDAIVNCTGPAHRPNLVGNPVLDSAIAHGLARADPFGLGLEVDDAGRALGQDGAAQDRLFVAGPLTRGRFGDIIAVAQITVQLQTVLPVLLGTTRNLVGDKASA